MRVWKFGRFVTMEVHGDISDQFPPMFTKFREFFEEQQKELFLSFEEQRTEMSNNFTSIVEERNRMIERNMNLIKDLNCEMKDMKTREEIFESENKKLKRELQKTHKELKESKDDFEHFDKHENEEISSYTFLFDKNVNFKTFNVLLSQCMLPVARNNTNHIVDRSPAT